MKDLLNTILFVIISLNAFSQREIYLESIYSRDTVISNIYGNDLKYQKRIGFHFNNLSDTLYIEIFRQEDMGIKASADPVFKDSIPNGRYNIYIDSVLIEELSFKNYNKHGARIIFEPNGEKEVLQYKNGKVKGFYKRFYPDGSLMVIAKIDSFMPIKTYYYNNGNLKTRKYFVNRKLVRIESYTEVGLIKDVKNYELLSLDKKYYEKGVLNGKYVFKYEERILKVKFKENKILNWRFLDSNGQLLMKGNRDVQ